MPRKPPPPSPAELLQIRDQQLAHLRQVLYIARLGVDGLVPKAIREDLHATLHCDTNEDVYAWFNWVAGRAAKFAEPIPRHPDRAFCPLCQRGATSPGYEGFALPLGLERHLLGTGPNAARCPILGLYFEVAINQVLVERERELATGRRPIRASVRAAHNIGDAPKPWDVSEPTKEEPAEGDIPTIGWRPSNVVPLRRDDE